MAKLTIVASIMAIPEKSELVKDELSKLLEPTHAEQGCVRYDLHVNNDDPNHFLFYETWESREHWQAHMNAPHLAEFLKASEGAVADLTIHEMSQIG